MITITGTVVPGDQRGRCLGFPTANLAIDETDDLDGVWAATVEFDNGATLPSAVSIGRRRTFYDETGEFLLEAHLIDFSGDIYGRSIKVHLRSFLRPQIAYTTAEALINQLWLDVGNAREALIDVIHGGDIEAAPFDFIAESLKEAA